VTVVPPPVELIVTVPVLLEVPPQAVSCMTPIAPAISTTARNRPRRFLKPRRPRTSAANATPPGRNGFDPCWRAALPLPLLMVTVSVRVESLPVGVIVVGLKVQLTVIPVLAAQEKLIVWSNPPAGVNVSVVVPGVLPVMVIV